MIELTLAGVLPSRKPTAEHVHRSWVGTLLACSSITISWPIRASRGPSMPGCLRISGAPPQKAVLAWHTDRLHRSPLELERFFDIRETPDWRPSRQALSTSQPRLDRAVGWTGSCTHLGRGPGTSPNTGRTDSTQGVVLPATGSVDSIVKIRDSAHRAGGVCHGSARCANRSRRPLAAGEPQDFGHTLRRCDGTRYYRELLYQEGSVNGRFDQRKAPKKERADTASRGSESAHKRRQHLDGAG